VLRFIALGATNREIAVQLMVSEGTIKNHNLPYPEPFRLRDRIRLSYARDITSYDRMSPHRLSHIPSLLRGTHFRLQGCPFRIVLFVVNVERRMMSIL